MGFFGHKERPRTTISTAPTSSSKPWMSVGQNGGRSNVVEYAPPARPPLNQRSEQYPYSQPRSQAHSQPRTTISTAPPSSHNPWVSVGENGGISNASEYAHPDLPQPLNQRSERYPHPQSHSQPQSQPRSQLHPLSHPQSQYQPRLYPHPAQRPEHNVARTPGPTKAENYFPPQHTNPNPSSSIAGSFANQPAALGAGYNNQDSHSSRAPQPSKKLFMPPPPSNGYVVDLYRHSQQAPAIPVSPEASTRGEYQGSKSNQLPSALRPGTSGQGQYQGSKSNQPPSTLPPRPSGQGQYQRFKSNRTPPAVSPLSLGQGQFQRFKSNRIPLAVSPLSPGQGQFQRFKSNRTPPRRASPANSDGISPITEQYAEFPSLNQYSR